MNIKKLLTVCIPAYNRVETLEKLLNQLLPQLTDDVELLVIDDCSPDNFAIKNMVSKYQNNEHRLRFYRNEQNLGFSGNVCQLYDMADSQYVWFLCDDDNVTPDAVSNVINAIKAYGFSVAIFNHTQYDAYGNYITAGVKKDIIHSDLSEIKDYNDLQRLTFLSTIVVEKIVDTISIKETNYRDNIFIQITLCLQILSKKMKFAQISKVILHRNVGYKYGEFFKFYLIDHLKSVNALPHVFDNSKFVSWSMKHFPTAIQLYLSQKLGLYVYNGSPTKETLEYLFKFYGPFASVTFLLPVLYLIVPGVFLKILYFLILCFKHDFRKALVVYGESIGRVNRDSRKTDFMNYR